MPLPEPFYDRKGIRIYCGDSREILDSIPKGVVSLTLTDPPYGIDADPRKFDKDSTFDKVKDDDQPFDPFQVLSMCNRSILWGANNFFMDISTSFFLPNEYGPGGGWIVWDKTMENSVKVKISPCELAWSNCFRGTLLFRHLWSGAYRASESGFHVHPTQKPVALMRWILELFTEPGDIVLDPYMGSGPVAQACHELGRRYVGIEYEEKYCEIAKGRLAVGNLFDTEPA